MLRRWVMLFFCTLVGCVNVSGEGAVVGWLDIEDCGPAESFEAVCSEEVPDLECSAFDLGADFFALELFDERTGKLRLQRGGSALHQTNGLVIEFMDIRNLRGRLGDTLDVGGNADVRAALLLGQTCPDSTQSLEVSGTITMRQFGTAIGDRIMGEINILEVRDGRDPLSGLLGVLHGRFDFRYQKGSPFEQFYR